MSDSQRIELPAPGVTLQLRGGGARCGNVLALSAESFFLKDGEGEREVSRSSVLRCVRPSESDEVAPRGVPAPGLEPLTPRALARGAVAPVLPVQIEATSLTPLEREASLREQLFGADGEGRVFALLEGARAVKLLEALEAVEARPRCLYKVPLTPEQAAVAPYLIEVSRGPVLEWLLALGWGGGWCVFLRSAGSPGALLRHARRFLSARDPEGEVLTFRPWDPRILRVLLAKLDEHEAATLFGATGCRVSVEGVVEEGSACPLCGGEVDDAACAPCRTSFAGEVESLIQAFVLESEHPDTLLSYSLAPEGCGGAPPRRDAARRQDLFSIRPALRAALSADFVYRQHQASLLEHARSTYAEQCDHVGEDEVNAAIRRGVVWAAGCGLHDAQSLRRFLDLQFVVDRRFWEQPYAAEWVATLQDRERTPSARLREVWTQAKALKARLTAGAETVSERPPQPPLRETAHG